MSFEDNQRLNRINQQLVNNINFLKEKLIKIHNTNLNLNDTINDIDREYNKLVDVYRCVVCYKNPKNIILEPCYHFSICKECLNKLNTCPVCRKDIECYHVIF